MKRFIDLTQTITHGIPVFPGEKSPSLQQDILPDEAGYVTHRLETNFHTGTHMDAAWHVKADVISIDTFPVSEFAAKALVIDVSNQPKVFLQTAWEKLFQQYESVLFYTGQSKKWMTNTYYTDYPEFDNQIAEALVNSNVRIVGFDSPSPDKAPFGFHKIFLRDGRFMIENMTQLDALLKHENVTLLAFPLKIKAEASLIRAVVMIEE